MHPVHISSPHATERRTDLPADHIRSLAAEIATSAGIPAISLAVADPTGVLFEGAVGYADLAQRRHATPGDQYLWFSMTKIATATAAMRLHADGQLDLDVPIGSYLDGYRPHAQHGHPTTRQLLSHTAGLRNPLPVRWIRPEDAPPDEASMTRIIGKHGTPRRTVGARGA
jgi:CubicO group peptidase (beta-lactamase class C family)